MSVAVVGAGAAGCAAAYTLRKLGHDVVLFEASAQVGGRTWTLRRDGFSIDTGAGFITTFYDRTLALVRELDREGSLARLEAPTGLWDGERLHLVRPDSPASYLKLSLLGWRDKLRLGARSLAIAMRPAPAPFDTDGLAGADTGETADAWARREFGEANYQYVIRPSTELAFGVGCEQVAAALQMALIKVGRTTRLLCLTEGMGALCEWLVDGLDVRTATRVVSVELAGERVQVRGEGDLLLDADAAVVATEAPAAADLLAETVDPPQVAGLREAPYGANVHVALGYSEDPWPDFPAGVVTPVGPGEHAVGSISLQGRKAASLVPAGAQLADVYFTDRASRELTEAEARRQARQAVAELIGAAPEPLFEYVFSRRCGLAIPRPGHYAAIRTTRDAMPPRIRLAGDYLAHASVEAAVQAGERAAQELHRVLA